MAITVRCADITDVPAVLDLWTASGAHPTHTDDVASLARLIDARPGALILALDHGIVVGSIIAGWDGWRGSIYRLVVAPTYRRRGLGTRLLGHAEDWLRGRGATRFAAIVVHYDAEAVAFWRSTGWVEQTHRVRFVKG